MWRGMKFSTPDAWRGNIISSPDVEDNGYFLAQTCDKPNKFTNYLKWIYKMTSIHSICEIPSSVIDFTTFT